MEAILEVFILFLIFMLGHFVPFCKVDSLNFPFVTLVHVVVIINIIFDVIWGVSWQDKSCTAIYFKLLLYYRWFLIVVHQSIAGKLFSGGGLCFSFTHGYAIGSWLLILCSI